MEIIIIIIFVIIVLLAKNTITYLIQSNKYKYLAAGVFYRHLQDKKVSSGHFEGYLIRDLSNMFDKNAIAIFNSNHIMLGYVAAKETYLFLPLFEHEKRIYVKGVVYLKKNIVIYKVCPDIDADNVIDIDRLPVDSSDELLRGEIVNISRDITSKDIPNEPFIGKLSQDEDIIEVYFKRKYLGTVRKNRTKFITPFIEQTGNYPCMLIPQKGKDKYDFYIDYIICSDSTKLDLLINKHNENPVLFNEIPSVESKK